MISSGTSRHAELARAGSKPAGAPPGSAGTDPDADPNHTGAPPGSLGASGPVQPSACEPYRGVILAKLEQGPVCLQVGGLRLDQGVAHAVLEAIEPAGVQAALKAMEQFE